MLKRKMLLLLPLCLAAGAAAADSWSRTSDVGAHPVRHDVDDQFSFAADGRIDIGNLGGSLHVAAVDQPRLTLHYERRAATQADFDCEQLRYEHSADHLTIRIERTHSEACREIRADDQLTLTVPRHASLKADSIGDSVQVSGVTGAVELSSVGDSAVLEGVEQLRADSIGDHLKLSLAHLAPAGINVSSVGDSVELQLAPGIGAELDVDSVGGHVTAPALQLGSVSGGVQSRIGGGGPAIHISSVGDDVVIR
ncbi:MAG TPA: hypothetical protein VHE37_13475 [Nevskiaceae bacterium]|nr:hypothetical protein [Nevskiaceae bacterium]